jgi:hypothetical protein
MLLTPRYSAADIPRRFSSLWERGLPAGFFGGVDDFFPIGALEIGKAAEISDLCAVGLGADEAA